MLSQTGPGESYWATIAAPMVLIGAGQGLSLAPMTSVGLAGVATADAGAASGLVNSFQQIGMAVGLAVLIAASSHRRADTAAMAARVRIALSVGTVLLALALVTVLVFLVRLGARSFEAVELTGIAGIEGAVVANAAGTATAESV